MRKIIILFCIFEIFSNLLYGYDALISPINSKSTSLSVIHEGNSIEELKSNINSSFTQVEIDSYITFQDEANKEIDNILLDRKFAEEVTNFIKDMVNLINLSTLKPDETTINELVKESMSTLIRGLKQFGITLSEGSSEKLTDGIVKVLLEAVGGDGKINPEIKTSPLFYLDLALDVLSIVNDMTASVRMNNFLFYYQVDNLANAYVRKYLDRVFDNKKVFSLKYFLNHYYFYENNYYSWGEFKTKTGKYPVYKDKIIQHLIVESNMLGALDEECSTTFKCMNLLPKLIVVAPVDLWNNVYKDFIGIDNFKKRLQENIDKKFNRFGVNQKLLFHMHISDNFEVDSKKGKTLTDSFVHKISDLSKVEVDAISTKNTNIDINLYCGSGIFGDDYSDKILSLPYRNTKIFYKVFNCKGYDNSYASLLLNYNNKLYSLVDNFKLLKRYKNVREHLNDASYYGYIRSLKIKGIKLNDPQNLLITNKITQTQATSLIVYANIFLVEEAGKYVDGTHLDKLGFEGVVTYAKLFYNLDLLMKHFYTDTYYLFDDIKGKEMYPFPTESIKLKVKVKKMRISARKYNSADYKKYIENLSRAGIIRLNLEDVSKKLHKPITIGDFIMYLSRAVDY